MRGLFKRGYLILRFIAAALRFGGNAGKVFSG